MYRESILSFTISSHFIRSPTYYFSPSLSDICRCLGHRLLYAESCRPLFEQAFSTSGTKRPAERSLSELSNKRHQPLMLHPDRKGMNRGDELGLHQSEDSPITSLPTAATVTGVNDNLMLGAPNSLPTHNPLESSAVCNAELDIAQDMGINTSVQQDSTNFAVNVGQTHQVSGNDINQVQLNHTQNGKRNSSYESYKFSQPTKSRIRRQLSVATHQLCHPQPLTLIHSCRAILIISMHNNMCSDHQISCPSTQKPAYSSISR